MMPRRSKKYGRKRKSTKRSYKRKTRKSNGYKSSPTQKKVGTYGRRNNSRTLAIPRVSFAPNQRRVMFNWNRLMVWDQAGDSNDTVNGRRMGWAQFKLNNAASPFSSNSSGLTLTSDETLAGSECAQLSDLLWDGTTGGTGGVTNARKYKRAYVMNTIVKVTVIPETEYAFAAGAGEFCQNFQVSLTQSRDQNPYINYGGSTGNPPQEFTEISPRQIAKFPNTTTNYGTFLHEQKSKPVGLTMSYRFKNLNPYGNPNDNVFQRDTNPVARDFATLWIMPTREPTVTTTGAVNLGIMPKCTVRINIDYDVQLSDYIPDIVVGNRSERNRQTAFGSVMEGGDAP